MAFALQSYMFTYVATVFSCMIDEVKNRCIKLTRSKPTIIKPAIRMYFTAVSNHLYYLKYE